MAAAGQYAASAPSRTDLGKKKYAIFQCDDVFIATLPFTPR